jgi:hypothetical protein
MKKPACFEIHQVFQNMSERLELIHWNFQRIDQIGSSKSATIISSIYNIWSF